MRFLLILPFLLLARPGLAQEGQRIYTSQCAPCHGADGAGNGPDAESLAAKPPDLRSGVVKKSSLEQLIDKIRDGRELPLEVDKEALRRRSQDVESLVAYLRRIPTIDWSTVEEGEVIYVSRCSVCHGETGKPSAQLPAGVALPPDLSVAKSPDARKHGDLVELVRHGRAGMPALVPRVPESEGPPLAGYVTLFSPGFTAYQEFCIGCHGRDGRGVGTLGEEIPLPTVVFDSAYFAKTDPEVLRAQVWHMIAAHKAIMPHYRSELSKAQIKAVAEYMKHHLH